MAPHPLIEAQELHALLAAPGDVVLLDVRWALGDPNGHAHYLDGHLPGAVFVDLHHELAAEPTPEAGRHPLPTAEAFQAAAQRWGINPDSQVVVYDATRALAAARAWWLLRHAGFDNVRVLNGGLDAWTGAGYPLEQGEHTAAAGTVELDWDRLPTIDIDQAEHFPGALLDARAFERYTGATEPIDPRAGHISGALSNPTTENLGADGRFLDPAELAERFAALGVQASDVASDPWLPTADPVSRRRTRSSRWKPSASGPRSSPGSWSQYSSDPTRTPATGETP